jgi:hypothetical protein
MYAAAALGIEYEILPWKKKTTRAAIEKCMAGAFATLRNPSPPPSQKAEARSIGTVAAALKEDLDRLTLTHPRCAIHLASALRLLLIEVASAKRAAVGKNEKMEILYAYLSGIEFRQRVEAIVEAFVSMQEDLQEERRSTERRWAKREKTIQMVITNTSGMYGDLQGLVGSSLTTIPALTSGDWGVYS